MSFSLVTEFLLILYFVFDHNGTDGNSRCELRRISRWRSPIGYFPVERLADSVGYDEGLALDRCHRFPNQVLHVAYATSDSELFRTQLLAFGFHQANIRPDTESVNRDFDRDTHRSREAAMWEGTATDSEILKQCERMLTAVSIALDSEFGERFVAKLLRSTAGIGPNYCSMVARLNKTGMPEIVKEAIDAARARDEKNKRGHAGAASSSSSRSESNAGGCGCSGKCATVQCPCKQGGAVCANARCGCDSSKCQNRRGKR